MPNTGLTQVPSAVNYFYDKVMLRKAVPLFVYTRWAQVKDIPRNNTNMIRFRRYSLLTAATTPLTEGVTPTGSQLSITNVPATVAQYGDFVTITDLLSFTTLDPLLTETAEVLGVQIGDTLDQLARNVLVVGNTVQHAASATARDEVSSAMKINREEVKEAVKTLKGNNTRKITSMIDASTGFNTNPIPACYIGICHTDTTSVLADVSGWVPVEQYGQKKAMEGEVGTLAQVRFIETTNAKVFISAGAGSIDVYATLIFGTDAYGISRISGEAMKNIIKPLGSAGSADPLDQRQTSGWKASFVCVILNQSFILRLEHAV